jgi:hypothetical protein
MNADHQSGSCCHKYPVFAPEPVLHFVKFRCQADVRILEISRTRREINQARGYDLLDDRLDGRMGFCGEDLAIAAKVKCRSGARVAARLFVASVMPTSFALSSE